MIKIKIPNNNIKERTYILDIILNEFLGIEFQLDVQQDCPDWEFVLENNKKIIFQDSFFNIHKENLSYLKEENFPKVQFCNNQFMLDENVPILYGNNKLKISEYEIVCGMDIFASSFFMLTRWEEYVNKKRDKHDRFSAFESVAYKNHFLNRPIVSEYVKMLKNMLAFLDEKMVFKEQKFELILTHDVDEIFKWRNLKHVLRACVGDVFKRKKINLALKRLAQYYLVRKGVIQDPYDTFDWLMDKSESIGVKSRFYFMSGGTSKTYDNNYMISEKKVLNLISKIKNRNHIIGYHPSYNAYNDSQQFAQEKYILEKNSCLSISEGREHYLRFAIPFTWQIWEDNNVSIDSTCGYADMEGFRCGTGAVFSVFNILSRQKLRLKERPLLFMDDNRYNTVLEDEEIYSNILRIKNIAIKYSFPCTLLFHNSIFDKKTINYKEVYEKIIN